MVRKASLSAKTFEKLAPSLGPAELVRGEVVELMAGGERHSIITATVTGLLIAWATRTRLGRVLTGEAGLITSRDPDTIRGMDVAYRSFRRLPRSKVSTGFSVTPPELVVEIVGQNQSWPELLVKTGEYLRVGVDRVWIIDADSRRLHIYRRDGEPTILDEAATITDRAILPGFRCRVRDFFA